VCFTNWSCNLAYSDSQSALAHYWPGDGLVDFIAIDEYPIGEITSTKDATPMEQRARRVAQFADARGIPSASPNTASMWPGTSKRATTGCAR
jgi:hypothetical protein